MDSSHNIPSNEARFWLEFQVCSDGSGTTTKPATIIPPSSRTFTLFPALPPEIRLHIWEQLILPRIVIAAVFRSDTEAYKRAQLAGRPSCPAVPPLLHVCRESRALALNHYELAFGWKIPRRLWSGGGNGAGRGAWHPLEREPRVWFNFARDALLLLGELEPLDEDGFNAPMVYFLRREDARRVRHVAVAFEALRYGGVPPEQLFGSLFHVVDRFAVAQRLIVTSTARDVEMHATVLPALDNVLQRVWSGWMKGTSVVTSSLADTPILIVGEDELESFIESHP